MNPDQFKTLLAEQGIILNEWQLEQYDIYYQTLVEWNEKMNLTAITDKEDVYLKHFYDSVSAGFYFDFNRQLTICDVGAGAGFPSIPLKIAFPELNVTIVDSLNKRITFLEHLAKVLKLENMRFIHDRAETFGQNPAHREKYEIVMARAVARMSVLSELCLPLARVGGTFIAMKGGQADDELQDGQKAMNVLGGELDAIHSFKLPVEISDRNILVINKKKKTPKQYPRKPGTPNKSPID